MILNHAPACRTRPGTELYLNDCLEPGRAARLHRGRAGHPKNCSLPIAERIRVEVPACSIVVINYATGIDVAHDEISIKALDEHQWNRMAGFGGRRITWTCKGYRRSKAQLIPGRHAPGILVPWWKSSCQRSPRRVQREQRSDSRAGFPGSCRLDR